MPTSGLVSVEAAARALRHARQKLDRRMLDALRNGASLREVGRAAGVDASTVKRIAERQK